jgi:hypothetical protein
MSTNNLYYHIKSWAFLHELRKQPDAVLWETTPENDQVPQGETEHMPFASLGYDFRKDGDIAKYLQTKGFCIIVLDTLSIASCKDILPIVSQHPHCLIINLGVGVTGIQNKHSLEVNDYVLVNGVLPIVEPIDSVQLHLMFSQWASAYMRIAHDETPDALFDANDQAKYLASDISMTQFGYTGLAWTIITSPHLLPSVSQAIQFIKTTQGIGFDLFVNTSTRETYSEELTSSLQLTGRLIRIHDQETNDVVSHQEKAVLQASQVQGDIQISLKHPVYATLTSLLPTYMYEQVGFDAEKLADYLLSLW